MRHTAALAEGEINAYEYLVLAWLREMGGAWHGKLDELHEALQWPYSPSHLSKLLRDLRGAGLVVYTAMERSRLPFDLELAPPPAAVAAVANPHGQTDCGEQPSTPGRTTHTCIGSDQQGSESEHIQGSDSLLNEVRTGEYQLCGDCGQGRRSSAFEGQEAVERPSAGAGPQAGPEPEPEWEALAEELDAELGAPQAGPAAPFEPYHGDERTGDTVGDDERAQLEWEGANPTKARARRRHH